MSWYLPKAKKEWHFQIRKFTYPFQKPKDFGKLLISEFSWMDKLSHCNISLSAETTVACVQFKNLINYPLINIPWYDTEINNQKSLPTFSMDNANQITSLNCPKILETLTGIADKSPSLWFSFKNTKWSLLGKIYQGQRRKLFHFLTHCLLPWNMGGPCSKPMVQ